MGRGYREAPTRRPLVFAHRWWMPNALLRTGCAAWRPRVAHGCLPNAVDKSTPEPTVHPRLVHSCVHSGIWWKSRRLISSLVVTACRCVRPRSDRPQRGRHRCGGSPPPDDVPAPSQSPSVSQACGPSSDRHPDGGRSTALDRQCRPSGRAATPVRAGLSDAAVTLDHNDVIWFRPTASGDDRVV